jgi:hypothetical protein
MREGIMIDLAMMQADVRRVIPRLVADGWVDADLADLKASLNVAAKGGNDADLQAWADWLAHECQMLDALASLCRAAERRIRADMDQKRKQQQQNQHQRKRAA